MSLLRDELLPLNLNFQVKMSKITLFAAFRPKAILEQTLLKHVGFLTFMAR